MSYHHLTVITGCWWANEQLSALNKTLLTTDNRNKGKTVLTAQGMREPDIPRWTILSFFTQRLLPVLTWRSQVARCWPLRRIFQSCPMTDVEVKTQECKWTCWSQKHSSDIQSSMDNVMKDMENYILHVHCNKGRKCLLFLATFVLMTFLFVFICYLFS